MDALTTDGVPGGPEVGETASVNRRQAIQKIAVGGAIVWGAPLIMGSTAAQAAGSVCGPRTLRWRNVGGDPITIPKVVVLDDVTVTITETFYGGTTSYSVSGDPDRDVLDGPYGGVGINTPPPGATPDSFLQLYQSAITNGGRRLVFTFTKTGSGTALNVKNIRFWITDIDWADRQYDDRVYLTPTFVRTNPASPTGSTVTGLGTPTDAIRNSSEGNVNVSNVKGSTRVTHAAGSSTFTLDFRCGDRSSGGHHAIFISDIKFDTCP